MMQVPNELLTKCLEGRRRRQPDLEAEAVLADWAEEIGLPALAQGLRSDPHAWMVAATLNRLIDASWMAGPINTYFQVGDIVIAKAHPGEWVVRYAGKHHEGHLILTVESVEDPGTQFFDLQKNFTFLRRPPVVPSGEEKP